MWERVEQFIVNLLRDKFPRFVGQCPAMTDEVLGVRLCCTEVRFHRGPHTI
jgi:hypothetical protein